jgi:alkyldihydroxyacetonephosphate synthase
MSGARLKHYGWGREDEGMTAEEQDFVLGRYNAKFARDTFETKAVPRLEDLAQRPPRVALPASLAAFCTSEHYDRVAHAYGKSYPDYVRAMLGDYDSAPDVVAYPRNESRDFRCDGLGRWCQRLADAVRGRVERLRRCRAASRWASL